MCDDQSAITYFQNNRSRMRYGDYLREGYPIASSIADGRVLRELSYGR